MPITSPTTAQLAHAVQIICNLPAYLHRPRIIAAAAERIRAARRADDVETVSFQFPQASLNQRNADAEQARHALSITARGALPVLAIAVILIVARSALRGAVSVSDTLAQAATMGGM